MALVMFPAWLQAKSWAKPGQNRLGQAGPKVMPGDSFCLAQHLEKPKPGHQTVAFEEIFCLNFSNNNI
jgi:hypothetical protein